MCGAPSSFLPPITMRFAATSRPTTAADAMDAGSPGPSSPSGSASSSETSATPCDFSMEPYAPHAPCEPCTALPSRRLVAEAAWGMAAARQMPQRQRRLSFAAKKTGKADRRRYQGSPATAMPGAPVPPPIKLRYVPKPAPAAGVIDAGSSVLGPPPIKVPYVPKPPPPPADVTDAGSSAPSTSSDSSWMETTPSPRGPLPSFSSPSSPCGLATTAHQMPPPFPTEPAPAPAPRVEVRQVWARNFDREAELIESLLPKFRYAAVDTEFPGTVYRPAGAAYTLTPERRYDLLRLNVDELDLIQLGLTLFDAGGRLPGLGGGTTRYVWEFNFREFDVCRHRHAPESIALLRAKGVDFDHTRQYGVAAAAFGPRLRKWLRAGLGRAGVVTFSGGYDVAYLVKTMFGAGFRMPTSAAQFEGVAKAALLRRRVFDVKEMARLCPSDLRGGLDSVAVKLDVGRAVGEAHQAGSDSLLTCHAFMKMRESYFGDDDDKLATVAGVLTDITAY